MTQNAYLMYGIIGKFFQMLLRAALAKSILILVFLEDLVFLFFIVPSLL